MVAAYEEFVPVSTLSPVMANVASTSGCARIWALKASATASVRCREAPRGRVIRLMR